MNIAILGIGHIAEKMAAAISGLDDNYKPYAAASRSIENATRFAKKWRFEKSYGSYKDLLDDENIDLVYIATPHSFHYEQALMCLNAGKNILVEKAFTANYFQAKELLDISKSKKLLAAEAIWTRYMPSRYILNELIESRIIGDAISVTASLCYPIENIKRLRDPSLAGGTLLDLGIYPLNFSSMIFGNKIKSLNGNCIKLETGVDAQESVSIEYENGSFASLFSSIRTPGDRNGVIYGTKGYITVQNINNPEIIRVYNSDHEMVKEIFSPSQINGYEYELMACHDAIMNGESECKDMPHSETLEIMRQMDYLRDLWGIKYPFE